MTNAIELQNVHQFVRAGFFNRRIDVLHGLNLSVSEGTIVGLVGPNGAGKSTAIKTLIGALTPHTGSAKIFGGDPKTPATRRRLGYLPETHQLSDTLTPRELMRLHGGLLGLSTTQASEQSEALLSRVDMTQRADDLLKLFSKGMRQRIALAVALLGNPDLLILDEPMSGLDPMGRALVRSVLLDEKRLGKTIFFSSHVLPDVAALCDTIAVMRKGTIIQTGSLRELFDGRPLKWEIEFVAEGPATIERARQQGELEKKGNSHHLRIEAADSAMPIVDDLRQHGAKILQVQRSEAELESLLVELMTQTPKTPTGVPT